MVVNNISVIQKSSGIVEIYMVDSDGQLWRGTESSSSVKWSKIALPSEDSDIPNSREW